MADPSLTPQINVGTGTLTDRESWAPVIDRFISDLAAFDFPGGRLDVRENVYFRGGHCGEWAHTTFPGSVCVLSIEVKKFFMDEWTGALDPHSTPPWGRPSQRPFPASSRSWSGCNPRFRFGRAHINRATAQSFTGLTVQFAAEGLTNLINGGGF